MDSMGFVGLWKVIVVKNLPYNDNRRVGKVPKFLAHRLFPSARSGSLFLIQIPYLIKFYQLCLMLNQRILCSLFYQFTVLELRSY
jgi:Protein of unknown function (DUF616)